MSDIDRKNSRTDRKIAGQIEKIAGHLRSWALSIMSAARRQFQESWMSEVPGTEIKTHSEKFDILTLLYVIDNPLSLSREST